MSDDALDGEVFKGRRYPPGVEPLEEHLYRYKIGDGHVEDLGWKGYVKIAHEAGCDGIDTEIVETGKMDGGILYAVAKVTVSIDGDEYSSVQAADETSNQVRDPEFVWAVAESRALKRVVKKALNIYPLSGDADPEKHRVEDSGGEVRRGPDGPEIDPPDEYKPDDEQRRSADDDFEF